MHVAATRGYVGSNSDSNLEEAKPTVANLKAMQRWNRFDETHDDSLAWCRLRQVVHVIDHSDE